MENLSLTVAMMPLLVLVVALCCGAQSSRFTHSLWHETQPKTWDEAQDECRSQGAELASLLSPADLQQMELQDFYAWFGLKKKGGNWYWIDGVNKVSTHSDPSQVFIQGLPEGGKKCGMVRFDHKRAYGEHCSERHFVFCEIHNNSGYHYPFVPEAKSWSEGQDLCLSKGLTYMDFVSDGEFDQPDLPIYEARDFPLWIGLRHDGVSWSWSDGSVSAYRSWASGSDPGLGSGSCVAVSSQSRLMSVHSCSDAFPFLCSKQNYSLMLLLEELSWEQAVERCRALSSSHRLLSLEESDLQYILPYTIGSTTSKVWVGLRLLAGSWFWSDGSPVSLSLPPCPDVRCGALVINTSSIEPSDCSEKLNALCYTEL